MSTRSMKKWATLIIWPPRSSWKLLRKWIAVWPLNQRMPTKKSMKNMLWIWGMIGSFISLKEASISMPLGRFQSTSGSLSSMATCFNLITQIAFKMKPIQIWNGISASKTIRLLAGPWLVLVPNTSIFSILMANSLLSTRILWIWIWDSLTQPMPTSQFLRFWLRDKVRPWVQMSPSLRVWPRNHLLIFTAEPISHQPLRISRILPTLVRGMPIRLLRPVTKTHPCWSTHPLLDSLV